MCFDPSQLHFCGNDHGMAVFSYAGVRITASVSSRGGFHSIAVGIGMPLPSSVLVGMLRWFGIDTRRSVDAVRYMDDSRCYIQSAA